MRRWPRLVYAVLSGALALVCLWFAVDAWLEWWGPAWSYITLLGTATVFFLLTSLALVRSWPIGHWFAGISGVLLMLYGLAVLLMGWEDVGGARGALPLGLGTVLVGALGLMVAVAKGIGRGEAA
jgi:hypothetical protein